ncbi:MAG: hypothetical protein RL632_150 [Bacteroidota bacterium]|jgi:hypothetical protein
MYISLTQLKPKGVFSYFRFWFLAIPTFRQAQTANGSLSVSAKRVNGSQCTITSWESREVMLAFMRSGAHLKAMKAFHKIATGRTYGFESDQLPTWTEAMVLLKEKGKDY